MFSQLLAMLACIGCYLRVMQMNAQSSRLRVGNERRRCGCRARKCGGLAPRRPSLGWPGGLLRGQGQRRRAEDKLPSPSADRLTLSSGKNSSSPSAVVLCPSPRPDGFFQNSGLGGAFWVQVIQPGPSGCTGTVHLRCSVCPLSQKVVS